MYWNTLCIFMFASLVVPFVVSALLIVGIRRFFYFSQKRKRIFMLRVTALTGQKMFPTSSNESLAEFTSLALTVVKQNSRSSQAVLIIINKIVMMSCSKMGKKKVNAKKTVSWDFIYIYFNVCSNLINFLKKMRNHYYLNAFRELILTTPIIITAAENKKGFKTKKIFPRLHVWVFRKYEKEK